ncbi:MAG: asparaginase [Clostridia bacterium]
MENYVPLVNEYRGKTLDLIHLGYLSAVDMNGKIILNAGDPNAIVYYRSASKPVQALPTIARHLDEKFGLTDEESVIFSASHAGEKFHISALESILKKTGLKEEMLIMKPAVPAYAPANEERIREGIPPRKLYHNCAGKHLSLLLLQRELGGELTDYYKNESLAQMEILRTIKEVGETDTVELGIDGCGVTVFAVPVRSIATAFLNLAHPEKINDEALSNAAKRFIPRIHEYPRMIRGTNYICSILNMDPNIVAKGGANGVYGFALKKEGIGVSFKLIDGTQDCWPLIIKTVLQRLSALSDETRERIDLLSPEIITNDNDIVVGERRIAF